MRRAVLIALVSIAIIGTLLSVWAIWRDGQVNIMIDDAGPETQAPIGSFSIYTDGEHGFLVTYPVDARVEYNFSSSYRAGSAWRANALPNATGTPLVAFVVSNIENETSYPRYYSAQVRVGASSHFDEIRQCERANVQEGEVALPDTVINGTTFKVFSFSDAGMMQYVRGTSYRVLRGDFCYALEKIAAGSTYREEPSDADLTEEHLEGQFEALAPIIQSFQFVDQASP